MLLKAAKVDTCPECEKCAMLLLDEMHIREDIVFDKHSGEMIGFANLGEINEHLFVFERSIHDDTPIFYLRPKPNAPADPSFPWFDNAPVGKNKLSTMVRDMCADAQITGKTNYSLRATGATTLFQAGVPEKIHYWPSLCGCTAAV